LNVDLLVGRFVVVALPRLDDDVVGRGERRPAASGAVGRANPSLLEVGGGVLVLAVGESFILDQ
jgi:hypothetical protein